MKRTDQELHERLQHADFMRKFDKGITADDPQWLKVAMTALLAAAVVVLLVYAAGAVLR